MNETSRLMLLAILVLALFVHSAVPKSDTDASQALFLSVNDFKMTVSEFNALVEYEQAVAETLRLPPVSSEDVISRIIHKQLLIQEAKKTQIIADDTLSCCEQESSDAALIKKLLATKSDELKMTLRVSDDELIDYYDKNRLHFNGGTFQKLKNQIQSIVLKQKIHQAMEKWIYGLRLDANIKVFRNHLKMGKQ